jgi:hypothetical protein
MTWQQQKAIAPGQIRSWELDLGAMAARADWARRNPELLRAELEQLARAFPMLVAALGTPLGEDRCWVEAAEPVLCPGCAELVVFDRGTRCARCEREVAAPPDSVVGLVGRIPALISGRPFGRWFDAQLARLRQGGDARADLFGGSLIEIAGRRYLAPRFALWFARSWPHADPPVMVWPEYFAVLNIPPDHVYHADQYYRLCLYASWREQAAAQVLQSRVVPRLLIDLMIADLVAVGRLDDALSALDMSLYEMYNLVGKPEGAQPLARIYERLVRLG